MTHTHFFICIFLQIRLVHVNSSQALKFSGRQLPDWGFRQHEIVTDKVHDQEDTIWNVEEHRYSKSKLFAHLTIPQSVNSQVVIFYY